MASESTHKTLDVRHEQRGRETGKVSVLRRRTTWIWLASLSSIALVLGLWGSWASRRDLDAMWAQAEADFQAKNYDRAESALRRLSRWRKPTPLDWFLRAQFAMLRNQTDLALANLTHVPDDFVMGAQARLTAGQLELRRDRARHAEELFRAAVRLDPSLVQAHRELIYIYGMQLRRAELNAEFLALSKLTELTPENVFHWCLLRTTTWEPREMVLTLTRYIEADPADRSSRLALADAYRRMGLPLDAESTLKVLPQDDSEAIVRRAQCALELHDQARAERLLALGRSDDPKLASLRGRLALARRDGRSALNNFRTAIAAEPDTHEVIFGLLSAMALSGETEGTAALRERAGKLENLNALVEKAASPQAREDPSLLRRLGAACAALDRDPEARAWYALAIRVNPLDSEAQRALFRLRDPDRAGNVSPPPPGPGSDARKSRRAPAGSSLARFATVGISVDVDNLPANRCWDWHSRPRPCSKRTNKNERSGRWWRPRRP
jgi:predicted Zn-dependent protease